MTFYNQFHMHADVDFELYNLLSNLTYSITFYTILYGITLQNFMKFYKQFDMHADVGFEWYIFL